VDYIAASFVFSKQNLLDLKEFLKANGGEEIAIIAKIENRTGIDNIRKSARSARGS
jgi:pyruvate kinase